MTITQQISSDTIDRAMRQWRPDTLAAKVGGKRESRNSPEWLFTDPICGSSRLRYNERKQTWICWGCRRTGNAVRLVQLLERVDEIGAMQIIFAGYTGGENRLDKLEDVFGQERPQYKRERVRTLPHMGLDFGTEMLDSPDNRFHTRAWEYLFSRGVKPESVREFRIGFCRFGKLRDYLVFPCYMQSKIVYWQGRATWDPPAGGTPQERKEWVARTEYRKTMNPFSKPPYATADEVLFNYDAAAVHPTVVVCEGPIDAVQVGPHAVATLGKSRNPTKIERLSHMAASHYVIYRDHSQNPKVAHEELEGAQELAEELSRFGKVSIATPPVGRDAGSFSREENAAILSNAVPYEGRRLQGVLM